MCAPSRACLASGRDYDHATVPQNFHNDFDVARTPTFYHVLRDRAAYTIAVSAGCAHTDADRFSLSDPFVRFVDPQTGALLAESEVRSNTLRPYWDARFSFEVQGSTLRVEVWDRDRSDSDSDDD